MHIGFPTALIYLFSSPSPTLFTHGFSSVTPLSITFHRHSAHHPRSHAHTNNKNTCSGTSLRALFSDDADDDFNDLNNNNDDHFDLEKVRERLESQLTSVGSEQELQAKLQEVVKHRTTVERPTIRSPTYQEPSPSLPTLEDVTLPLAPPLTTIGRERREAEIQLLGRLTEGDESVSELWTLWFGERGSEAAQKLQLAEELTNDGPQSWTRAEGILRSLIEEYGVYWAEPVNRLATLHYMQGRLDEAEALSKVVLAVKPWHFGALSGIVMIYAAQADSENARLWAASRLPQFAPTGANRRRAAWAEKAVQSAQESLANAEQRVQDLFGAPDDYIAIQRSYSRDEHEDDEAWQ